MSEAKQKLVEPAVRPRHEGGVSWVEVGEIELDFAARAVKQGSLGDCWLLSTLAAVAETRPQFIRESVRRNSDGTFAVRLFVGSRALGVTVSALVPSRGGKLLYARGPSDEPNWASIVEKAVATLPTFGGYQGLDGADAWRNIGRKGWAKPATKLLTGGTTRTFVVPLVASERFWQDLKRAKANGVTMTASTGPWLAPWLPFRLHRLHQYVVTSFLDDQVVLRNPHNSPQRSLGSSSDLGTQFTLTRQDFMRHFVTVEVGRNLPWAGWR